MRSPMDPKSGCDCYSYLLDLNQYHEAELRISIVTNNLICAPLWNIVSILSTRRLVTPQNPRKLQKTTSSITTKVVLQRKLDQSHQIMSNSCWCIHNKSFLTEKVNKKRGEMSLRLFLFLHMPTTSNLGKSSAFLSVCNNFMATN